MPRKNIYIRNEDADRWEAIENKSEFIHNALQPFGTLKTAGAPVELKVTGLPDLLKKPKGDYKLPEGLVTEVPKTSRFDGPLCKIHNLPLDARGKCLQKGCKYS